jgi:hypothetical protein
VIERAFSMDRENDSVVKRKIRAVYIDFIL